MIEHDTPEQLTLLPKQRAQLPKQRAQLPKQRAQLPKQRAQLPKQRAQLPKQRAQLPTSDLPVRFRLDAATRRRGLRHVAEIRRQLAERQTARSNVAELPVHPPVRSTAA
jgi:multidrug resistance efflux pump